MTGLELLSRPEQTGSVLGLSFLLGFLIGAVLTFVSVVILGTRSRTRASPG